MPVRARSIACIVTSLPALALDLGTAWEPLPYVASRWTGVCEDAQRRLLKQ